MDAFNNKKHSDLTVTVTGGREPNPQTQTFYLHKFPLVSKSQYFDENIPDDEQARRVEMRIEGFPGGPAAFEQAARYCYGVEISLTTDDIAYTYCAARYLRIPDLEKSTDAFLNEVVLQDAQKAARVLRVATEIENMTEEMMEGLVGHCINAIAARFAIIPQLNDLPPDCFACIVRNARDMEVNKRLLETAVEGYLDSRVSEDAANVTVDDFIQVVSAPGRMEDMRHCEAIYGALELMLRHYTSDELTEKMCKSLHELGFWVCLPHVVIEKAYGDRYVPDRFVTVALMAENRHLLKVNEQLAEQVENLMDTLRTDGGAEVQPPYPGQQQQGPPPPQPAAGGGGVSGMDGY